MNITFGLKLKIFDELKHQFKDEKILSLFEKKFNYILLLTLSFLDFLKIIKITLPEFHSAGVDKKYKLKKINSQMLEIALNILIKKADEKYQNNELIMDDRTYDKLIKMKNKVQVLEQVPKQVQVLEQVPEFGKVMKIQKYEDLLAFGYNEGDVCQVGEKYDGIGCTFFVNAGKVERLITRNGREVIDKDFSVTESVSDGWHHGEITYGESRMELFRQFMKGQSDVIFSIVPYEKVMKEVILDKKMFLDEKRKSKQNYKKFDGFCIYLKSGEKFAVKHYKE